MNKIVIGKYALESLTSGMYADPFVIYREYIQNAVDSIDGAFRSGLLIPGQEQVLISMFPLEGRIEITDNGLGIAADEAEYALTGIGNSKKDPSSTRGFRGIGRLSALCYCQKLTFETSYFGEKSAVRVIIDAAKLTALMTTNGSNQDTPATEVMNQVCTFELYEIGLSDHFFKVIMDGIDENNELLKPIAVKEYIEQVAPVPFNPHTFTWGKEIVCRVKQIGYHIPQYRIQVSCAGKYSDIWKPYQDRFLVDKSKNLYDTVQDIKIHKVLSTENKVMAIVWIADTNCMGSIIDHSIKGLRIRKGNILIGDGQTLNTVFKDARFNGWTIGEVYALDPELLPNARRDNFEKTPSHFLFFERMSELARGITTKIRAASLMRNASLKTAVEKTEKARVIASKALEQPEISSHTKGIASKELHIAQIAVSDVSTCSPVEGMLQEIAFNEIDMLIGKIQGSTSYKAINLLDNLGKTEKKILEKVFRVLQSQLPEAELQKISDAILSEFSSKLQ